MAIIKIEEHPLYVWLKKDKYWNAYTKLQSFLPTLEQYELSSSDNNHLMNILFFYIQEGLDGKADMNTISGKNLSDDSKMMKACQYLHKIMPLDKNKKTHMWHDKYMGLMDQFKPMSDFFDKEYPEYIKRKGFRKRAAAHLEVILGNFTSNSICLNREKFDEAVAIFDNRFARYNAKPNFEDLMKKSPSLFLAKYSNKWGYDLSHQELEAVFHSIVNIKKNALQNISIDGAHTLGNMYAEILADSIYFKNSLAPTKNIEASLKKFLNEKTVENPINNYEYFINAALSNPVYQMKKMVLDFDKKNRLATMGKSNLTKEEYNFYEIKKEEQLAQAPKPKKLKI